MTERQCQNWFAIFRSANFNPEDAPCPGRPLEADVDKIKSLVDANLRKIIREIAERLKCVKRDRLGLISKLDIWVPHVFTYRNLLCRINDCDTLIRHQRKDPFLKRMVTGDEKWVVYNNVKRKRS